MFVDINTQQVKVQRNLVNEISSSLNIDDEDPRKRLSWRCRRLGRVLVHRQAGSGRKGRASHSASVEEQRATETS